MSMYRLKRSGRKCLALLGVLVLCLTGCGKGETAEEASYEKSIAAYRASERANILIKQNVSMEDGSTVMTSQLLGLLEIKNPGGENTEAGMTNSTITMNLGGDDMQISFSNYYKDSMLYTSMRGNQYAEECDWKTAEASLGPAAAPLSGLEAQDFQRLDKTDGENNTIYDFEITGENVGKIPGVQKQWNRFAESCGTDSVLVFQNASGQLTVGNSDSRPEKEILTVTGTIQAGGRTIQVTEQIELSFVYNMPDDPEIPDVSSYRKISAK